MDLFQALILSFVEGLSEFLPISSTAHLVLTAKVLAIEQTEFIKSFEIAIQLGAILSVVVIYWKKFLVKPEVLKRVLVAFIPTAVVGYLLYSFIKDFLIGNLMITVVALFVGGILIILFEKFKDSSYGEKDLTRVGFMHALFIGLFQSISVIPGVSRAAATIFGGMIAGLNRSAAVEFSFLLAVPTMAAATGLDLVNSYQSFSASHLLILLTGFVASFLVATAAIKFLISYVQKNNFVVFGIYRIIISVVFYLLFLA